MLHVGVREESEAGVAFDGAFDGTGHVGALRYFGGGDLDLQAEAVGVGDGGAVDDAVETGPERAGHAHGAGFAGGVERVAAERKALELLAGEADAANLGVGAGVVLRAYGVVGSHETGAGDGVEDVGAEGDGAGGFKREGGPCGEVAHALGVECAGRREELRAWISEFVVHR